MPAYFRSTFTFEGKRYFIKGKTQREADQKAALKKAQLEAGVVAASAMTVARWWSEYIEVYKAGTSARTLELYRGIYKATIGPYFGPLFAWLYAPRCTQMHLKSVTQSVTHAIKKGPARRQSQKEN